MYFRSWVVALILFIGLSDMGIAQHPTPVDTSNILGQYQPATYLSLAGEARFTNYGFTISVPIFWVENSLKITPLAGLFWDDFAEDGFAFNPAVGARFLYFFKKQFRNQTSRNSFYAGVGGIATVNDFFGQDVTERSLAGVIAGHTFSLSQAVQLAPELLLGVDEDGDFRPAIGVVLHFGK